MQQHKTVEEVASRTGQPARRLGVWCATGQLTCEPVDGTWALPDSEIPKIRALAHRLGRLPGGRCAVALALPTSKAGAEVATQVAKRLGLEYSDLRQAQLAVDGAERALVVWPHTAQARAAAALADLADELDGELIDASLEAG